MQSYHISKLKPGDAVYFAADVEKMEQAHRSELGSIVTEHEERCAAASKCIKELKEESKKLYDEAVDENRKICLTLDKVRQAHREEIAKYQKYGDEHQMTINFNHKLKDEIFILTARCKRLEEALQRFVNYSQCIIETFSSGNPFLDLTGYKHLIKIANGALKEAGQ